jgi:hypothetical protein
MPSLPLARHAWSQPDFPSLLIRQKYEFGGMIVTSPVLKGKTCTLRHYDVAGLLVQ